MRIFKRLVKHLLLYRKLGTGKSQLSFFAKYDDKCFFGDYVSVQEFSSFRNSQIGAYSSLGKRATIWNTQMGKFCSLSWDVTIGAGSHHLDRVSTHAFPYIKKYGFAKENERISKQTKVGNDVWIGTNAIILDGLTVGNGAIIGAGAVVTKDVPDYAVVVGVPAKIVKYRFEQDTINALNHLKWWDWEEDKLKEALALFRQKLTSDIIRELGNLKSDENLGKKT